jgi:hypothetical protein
MVVFIHVYIKDEHNATLLAIYCLPSLKQQSLVAAPSRPGYTWCVFLGAFKSCLPPTKLQTHPLTFKTLWLPKATKAFLL